MIIWQYNYASVSHHLSVSLPGIVFSFSSFIRASYWVEFTQMMQSKDKKAQKMYS